MMALLSPRFWLGLALVAALTFTHYFVYKSGKAAVRVEWDKERAEQMADALKADQANRVKETALNAANQKVANDYITQKKKLVAAAAISDGKLREFTAAAVDSAASGLAGTDGGSDDPRDALLAQCGFTASRLDDYAKEVAAKAIALQEYAKLMRLK